MRQGRLQGLVSSYLSLSSDKPMIKCLFLRTGFFSGEQKALCSFELVTFPSPPPYGSPNLLSFPQSMVALLRLGPQEWLTLQPVHATLLAAEQLRFKCPYPSVAY